MAPNKTLAAQLYSEMREFFPENAVEYFVSYYDYYQPEAYVPARDLFIEKDSSINEHIEQMRSARDQVAAGAARHGDRRDGVGDLRYRRSVRLPQHDPAAAREREDEPARRHHAADADAVRAQRHRFLARPFPRARRRHRHLSGGARRDRDSRRTVRRCGGNPAPVRPADRADSVESGALHRVPVQPLRDPARDHVARDRADQGRAARAAGVVLRQRQAGRGAAAGAAHPLRPRNDGRAGLLQGHRELLAPSVGAQAGRSAADADRLSGERCADVHRRVARHRDPGRRHVQGRPLAQGKPGRLRFPPAVGARQSSAQVRGVRGADAADRVRLGDAGQVRGRACRPGGRAGGAPDRAGRSAGRGAAGRRPRSTT